VCLEDGELIPPLDVFPDELAATGPPEVLLLVLAVGVALLLVGLAFWAARSWAGAIEYRCSSCSWRARSWSPGGLRALADSHQAKGCNF